MPQKRIQDRSLPRPSIPVEKPKFCSHPDAHIIQPSLQMPICSNSNIIKTATIPSLNQHINSPLRRNLTARFHDFPFADSPRLNPADDAPRYSSTRRVSPPSSLLYRALKTLQTTHRISCRRRFLISEVG